MKTKKVIVCANCLRASCWHSIFICEKYRSAGIIEKTRTELKKLGYEHPSYWELDNQYIGE